MTDASVVAVGTPQSFRQQLARSLELEADEVGWVQSATAAEEPASFECSVQAPAAPSSYSPCSPPKTFTGLADGSYQGQAQAPLSY